MAAVLFPTDRIIQREEEVDREIELKIKRDVLFKYHCEKY